MKEHMIETFSLPLKILMSHTCESCGYEMIIFDRKENVEINWGVLGVVSFCPRCGAPRGRVRPTKDAADSLKAEAIRHADELERIATRLDDSR
jgi:hypothetical protein